MPWRTSNAELYLDGTVVGTIELHGWHGAWGFGRFSPNEAFDRFRPRFARWADLFHRADASRTLSPELAAGLRQAEFALYRIKAHLRLPAVDQWRRIDVLNIDGSLVEWKEAGPDRPAVSEGLMGAGKVAS